MKHIALLVVALVTQYCAKKPEMTPGIYFASDPVVDNIETKKWHKDGELHREDGPAIIKANGTKSWYINGKQHREDGPACIDADGSKYWYINGVKYSEEEWKEKVKSLK